MLEYVSHRMKHLCNLLAYDSHLPSTLVATATLSEAVLSIQSPFAKQITLINPLSLTYPPPNTYPFPFSSKFFHHHVDISWWWCDGRL